MIPIQEGAALWLQYQLHQQHQQHQHYLEQEMQRQKASVQNVLISVPNVLISVCLRWL